MWRELAVDAWTAASQGPVQLNLAFREPLLGVAGDLPERSDGEATSSRRELTVGESGVDRVPCSASAERGLILVGGRHGQAR